MDVILLGASVRALAQSARRAGWQPTAIDLYADRDLKAIAAVHRVEDPQEWEVLARAAPPGPWMYTGGLENHPGLIDRLARQRPLWGIGGEALRGVRDPFRVHKVLGQAGLPVPDVRSVACGVAS